jgi:hypothetical protein
MERIRAKMADNRTEPYQFNLQLDGGPDLAPEELDAATRQLRSELLDLQVESVDLVASQDVPAGAKSAEAITLGTMAITVLPIFIPKIIEFLQSWVTRNDGKTVKVKSQVGDRSIELEFSKKAISQQDLKTLLDTLSGSLAASAPRE